MTVAAASTSSATAAVQTPLCDRRSYRHAQLPSGVRLLVVQDPDAVFAAACANVRCGYFDDDPAVPGTAHFLEHAVHLGSEAFPDDKDYKQFLARHGGSSNASTSMVHTRYHLTVHSTALQGALLRLGALLSCPLLRDECAAREVENVDAEYCRNTNSDQRKLLQLQRSFGRPPYSNFSTGSLDTLWTGPTSRGLDVPALLQRLWQRCYQPDRVCVAVVAPQPPEQLLGWLQEAFSGLQASPSSSTADASCAPASSSSSGGNSGSGNGGSGSGTLAEQQPLAGGAGEGDVCGERGLLVKVVPERDIKELELQWFIPSGAMQHSTVKPWKWAAHLLGQEGPGSVAHLLKAQGLIQRLEVGMGDEVRLGRGWMFWGVTVQLSQASEADKAVEHVVATVFQGIQLLARCTDEQLLQTWSEAAELAALNFDWQDPAEPLTVATSAASSLHYYSPSAVLSGGRLMPGPCQPDVLRWFVQQLSPQAVNVFWQGRRHERAVDSRERWYGARYSQQQLPQSWLQRVEHYASAVPATHGGSGTVPAGGDEPGEPAVACVGGDADPKGFQPGVLHLPEANWALPHDLALREAEGPAADAPDLLLDQAGCSCWHKLDTSFGLPKVILRLHLVTPAVYDTPQAAVAARLLLRILDDLLLPHTYPAELAGSRHSISAEPGGLLIAVTGFQGVAQQLLLMVLKALTELTLEQVQERFPRMHDRVRQSLLNWAQNNPADHAAYGAHHLLQLDHHHNSDLMEAVAAATPQQVMELQARLAAGLDMHADMLAFGNISRAEATQLAQQVQQHLRPQGLAALQGQDAPAWPAVGRVLRLSPAAAAEGSSTAAPALPGAAAAGSSSSSSRAAGGGYCTTYLPDNPNPSNTNHACFYVAQLGPDDVHTSVLLDAFVQLSSKAAFHELRTRQRLGYSVSLGSRAWQRQLALTLRVQSPTASPDAVAAAGRSWLAAFRAELQQLPEEKLSDVKVALAGRYLQPPKSLREAGQHAWLPIQSRTLDWGRREAKANVARNLSREQLLGFYDEFLSPGGPQHRALCVQVWGGKAGAARAAEAVGSSGAPGVLLLPRGVRQFKQQAALMPQPDLVLPSHAPAA